jgi:hypothetical protein
VPENGKLQIALFGGLAGILGRGHLTW